MINKNDQLQELAIEAEAKAALQPPSGTCEMDARCLRSLRPTKKDKITSSSKLLGAGANFIFEDKRIEAF